ncbi:hypothetical protein EVAR_16840_1 [Eumeta japonica]|uniref:Uncharacterized protein n=1 Tax=Eumeta variegata TaxID=151549 RepID=A0A4C1V318_EUMVA|nr:hypothetical protein EVAR_16840_1 [Eumeta japonica]
MTAEKNLSEIPRLWIDVRVSKSSRVSRVLPKKLSSTTRHAFGFNGGIDPYTASPSTPQTTTFHTNLFYFVVLFLRDHGARGGSPSRQGIEHSIAATPCGRFGPQFSTLRRGRVTRKRSRRRYAPFIL